MYCVQEIECLRTDAHFQIAGQQGMQTSTIREFSLLRQSPGEPTHTSVRIWASPSTRQHRPFLSDRPKSSIFVSVFPFEHGRKSAVKIPYGHRSTTRVTAPTPATSAPVDAFLGVAVPMIADAAADPHVAPPPRGLSSARPFPERKASVCRLFRRPDSSTLEMGPPSIFPLRSPTPVRAKPQAGYPLRPPANRAN